MAATVVFLTGTGTFTVPANVYSLRVQAIAEGGAGGSRSTAGLVSGGGGGAYAELSNYLVTPGQNISYVNGAGGSGTDTNFDSGALIAQRGMPGTTTAGGSGGLASSSTGDIVYDGGNGGTASGNGAGGGGGAASPLGAGKRGGNTSNLGAAGGGGAGGPLATNGVDNSSGSNGSNGGVGPGSDPGGVGSTGSFGAQPGTNGSGGGGAGTTFKNGANGSQYAQWTQTSDSAVAGPGSGGGGGQTNTSSTRGGNGGGYGGGGGGGRTAGTGAPGIIVITYTETTGAIAGSSVMAIADGAQLLGAGVLSGAAAAGFADVSVLQGVGALAGLSAEQFQSSAASIIGAGSMIGANVLSLADIAALAASGALAGQSTAGISLGSILAASGSMAGIGAAGMAAQSQLLGAGVLAGLGQVSLAPAASIVNITPIGILIGGTSIPWRNINTAIGAGALIGNLAILSDASAELVNFPSVMAQMIGRAVMSIANAGNAVRPVTESEVLAAVRRLLLEMVPGVEIVRGQDNRVAEPVGPDFIVMWALHGRRLATNEDTWDWSDPSPKTIDARRPTQMSIQLDIHGPSSWNIAMIISTLWRDDYAVSRLDPSICTPLYASDGQQMPFIGGEKQYENRWTMTLELQVNPVISTGMDFADTLDVTFMPPVGSY
jgi:hypothetical protein